MDESAKIDRMKRSEAHEIIRKLPMIWRVILGIVLAIAAIFVKYLTEVFHVSNNSWTIVLTAVIWFLAILGLMHFLKRKVSN
jgi:hypothetical protein